MHSIGNPSCEAMTVDLSQVLFRPSPEVEGRGPLQLAGWRLEDATRFPCGFICGLFPPLVRPWQHAHLTNVVRQFLGYLRLFR